MAQAVTQVPALPEWHDAALLRREKWPGFIEALRVAQVPAELPGDIVRSRLAYDELLADQVALALVRGRVRTRRGRPLAGDGNLRTKALGEGTSMPAAAKGAVDDGLGGWGSIQVE